MQANILENLIAKLRADGPQRWREIAAKSGCNFHTIRKIAYHDIENPGVVTIQPLLDYYAAIKPSKRTAKA